MYLILILLLAGFVLLIVGADYLVKGASALARRLNVSELTIGLTIVAFGTSAPELVVSVVSSAKGLNEVVYGNVIGSNVFNLFFILGVAGIIYPIIVQRQTIWKEIPYSLFAVIVMFVLLNDSWFWGGESYFSRIDAFILLFFFIAFLVYIYLNLKEETTAPEPEGKSYGLPILIIMIVGGLAGLVFGGRLVVNNATELARMFEVSDKLIGLTIIATGTSLPELATSALAAFKKRSDIAIGNVVGSNIFNIFLILPVSGLISPMSYPSELNTDIYVLVAGTALVFIAMFSGKAKKLERWEALILLLGYIAYVAYLIYRA